MCCKVKSNSAEKATHKIGPAVCAIYSTALLQELRNVKITLWVRGVSIPHTCVCVGVGACVCLCVCLYLCVRTNVCLKLCSFLSLFIQHNTDFMYVYMYESHVF